MAVPDFRQSNEANCRCSRASIVASKKMGAFSEFAIRHPRSALSRIRRASSSFVPVGTPSRAQIGGCCRLQDWQSICAQVHVALRRADRSHKIVLRKCVHRGSRLFAALTDNINRRLWRRDDDDAVKGRRHCRNTCIAAHAPSTSDAFGLTGNTSFPDSLSFRKTAFAV
jgi:hypothetical protein